MRYASRSKRLSSFAGELPRVTDSLAAFYDTMVIHASLMENQISPALPGVPASTLNDSAAPSDNSFADILSEFEQQHHGAARGEAMDGTVSFDFRRLRFRRHRQKNGRSAAGQPVSRRDRRAYATRWRQDAGQHHRHGLRRVLTSPSKCRGPRTGGAGTRVCREAFHRRPGDRAGERRIPRGRGRPGVYARFAQRHQRPAEMKSWSGKKFSARLSSWRPPPKTWWWIGAL